MFQEFEKEIKEIEKTRHTLQGFCNSHVHCSELAIVARFDEVLVEVADANVLRLSELAARTDAAALIRQERLEREESAGAKTYNKQMYDIYAMCE